MKITIEKDKFGNILRHLTQDGEDIKEIIYQYISAPLSMTSIIR